MLVRLKKKHIVKIDIVQLMVNGEAGGLIALAVPLVIKEHM